ncbi:ferritin-like domain-containing protein [Polyangium sp. y55x31]|uniref:ferritin-like domain-containing protein n=1 Tax=Polyangium sp. y55x31 TaxID=3042688 RepID=UPI0024824CF4|nr:ferritin-like domain-containing protein [Polyangium sp. y55x31]MDI1484087.1 ferritin-like domain-containing protein [Polyangium sp. y55x31]
MFDTSRLTRFLPPRMQSQIDAYFEALDVLLSVKDPKVLGALGPSGVRGLILHRGKQGTPTDMPATHVAHFDWTYPSDQPEMADLYRRAKVGQWNGDDLPWHTSVDPFDPERPLIPEEFLSFEEIEALGIKIDKNERTQLSYSMCAWMLSQFLHGEQGALFAAAQVTEAVQFFDGKLYGATQVMDEGRHVEVFNRYLDTKLHKLYQINDNLFVIIDSLMTDGRWDMKFLGMQIMVEGLALGAFGTLYKLTKEPLLKELLKMVIQDEARHVHYGVCALREHFTKYITERERQEREDWAFEVALLMRNRFAAYEVYDEWFEGRMTRAQWRGVVDRSKGMVEFRTTMFSRLVPNLREIGLLSPRIMPRYEEAGLMRYFGGLAADKLTADKLLADLH